MRINPNNIESYRIGKDTLDDDGGYIRAFPADDGRWFIEDELGHYVEGCDMYYDTLDEAIDAGEAYIKRNGGNI